MSLAPQCQPHDSVFTIDRRIAQADYCAPGERFVSLLERLCNDHA